MNWPDVDTATAVIAAWLARGAPTDTKGVPVEVQEATEDAVKKRQRRRG